MFRSLFRRKERPIRLLGRGGMAYNDGLREYYIDSDNMPPRGSGYGIVIFCSGIKLKDSVNPLSDEEKNKIAVAVKNILEQKGGKVKIEG